MASKRYQNWVLQSRWAKHIERWRASGLTGSAYCRQHRLDPAAFDGWLKKLGDAEALQDMASCKPKPGQEQRKLPQREGFGEVRNKAMQAFWAMHVEAQLWSGLSAAEYASAHRLSPYLLREWRRRLDAEPLGSTGGSWFTRAHAHMFGRRLVLVLTARSRNRP